MIVNAGLPELAVEKKNRSNRGRTLQSKKIWIDLDNSPHVPFFHPIIKALKQRGYPLLLTGRDAYQVRELTKQFGLDVRIVGKHFGKKKYLKAAGLAIRVIQLIQLVMFKRPALAVSHGSRAMSLTCILLRIPSFVMFDYEHTAGLPKFLKQNHALVPAMLPENLPKFKRFHSVTRYDGLKEDVYVSEFKADSNIYETLKVKADDLIVTIRPPATEAHYHNEQSEQLFSSLIQFFAGQANVKMVILPRNHRQYEFINQKWDALVKNRTIILPRTALNGLNLIWHSDLVISGGGTMNREAAALGVPVYSIFRGKIGAVDHHLAESGKLVLLETVEDIFKKVELKKRDKNLNTIPNNRQVLNQIVNEIIAQLEA